MKELTDIGLVALGLVAGVVLGQLLQYNKKRIENFITKYLKRNKMNVFEKIKLWFTSVSKIVKFLTDTFGEAKILKDKQANFKDWVEFIIAFIKDALQYADEIAALSQAQPVQTKGKVIKAVKENKSLSANYKTAYFKEKAQNFNK